MDQIEFFEPPWQWMLDEISPLQDVRCAARLGGPLREAIHSFKYEGLRALARTLGEVLYDCWDVEPWPVDVIVPVPLHPSRLRERGYNQSALLARELARHTNLPVAERVLLRIIPTPPQVGLNVTERAENVRGAFRCRDLAAFPNLTVKKIPAAVLDRCEWGKDDYSLKVENLPKAPAKAGQMDLFGEGGDA